MKLFRYELYCDNAPQDVGFLAGVDELGLSAEKEAKLIEAFDSGLHIPDSPTMRGTVSFFTEEGNRRFRNHIHRLAAAYEDSMFDIKICTLDLPEELRGHIVYEDGDQVCIPSELYRGTLAPMVTTEPFPHKTYSQGPFKLADPFMIGDLFHVGTMDITKKTKFSHEWNGLSISNCPDSWCRITEGFTHGDLFKLSKSDMKLLDYYAMTDEENAVISSWAIAQGYVEEGVLYKSLTYDEDGSEYYSLYSSYESALEESDYDEDRVQKILGLLPTKKLLDLSMVKVELLDIPSIITALYAEQVLDYDGIYWDEELDEAAYSAPRGVIFNSKLPSFEVQNLTKEAARKQPLVTLLNTAASKTQRNPHEHLSDRGHSR